jgi:hypothetical protein
VTLTAVSTRRKKAVIAFLQGGSFFGEGCLGGQSLRICTCEINWAVQYRSTGKGEHGSHTQVGSLGKAEE